MFMLGILLARRKRMGENNKHLHYQSGIIPVHYGIITLAFVFAVSYVVNMIEEEKMTVESIWWNDFSRQRKDNSSTHEDELSLINNLNANHNEEHSMATLPSTSPVQTIGWVLTITGCPGRDAIMDGAAVVKHSIHMTSIHGTGKYDYKLYAIYHPDGEDCALALKDLGIELIRRDIPVPVKDIKGKFLRKKIVSWKT